MYCEINTSNCVSIERTKTKRNDVIQMSTMTYENVIARKNARRARMNNKRTRAYRRTRVENIARHIERAYVAQTRQNDTHDVVRDIENALIDLLNAH
jgi:hypothetical protein